MAARRHQPPDRRTGGVGPAVLPERDEAGIRRGEAARIDVEAPEIVIEVDMQPLTSRCPRRRHGFDHELCAQASGDLEPPGGLRSLERQASTGHDLIVVDTGRAERANGHVEHASEVALGDIAVVDDAL